MYIAIAVIVVLLLSGLRVAQEYQRGVVFLRKGSVPEIRCSAPSDAGLCTDGFGDHFARIEGFLRVLGLDAAVAVAEFFKIATSLLKHAAADVAEPFETVVVRGGWVGIHGAVSRSSSGVIN